MLDCLHSQLCAGDTDFLNASLTVQDDPKFCTLVLKVSNLAGKTIISSNAANLSITRLITLRGSAVLGLHSPSLCPSYRRSCSEEARLDQSVSTSSDRWGQ